ncbi:MAG: phenylacetate-CoA oxygenase/reductase subunit PaaK [Bacteroidetes bacterium]|nr:MAG: phenylacetate-CoA oxygenase/reductase subunit PaaK [Bacteroidota bacterium]
MSIHFHRLTIKQIKKETSDCVSVLFEVPENLKEIFGFTQGQNITLRTFQNGQELRRSYSICAAPHENELRVAVKKMDNGQFSSWANTELKAGDIIEVLPPTGRFYTELNPANKKKYAAFAAGSGITPIISIIKSVLRNEPHSEFTLIYGNKSISSIIFKEEIEAIKNKYINRFNPVFILSRETTDAPLFNGRIDTKKLSELSKIFNWKSFDEFFLCGPEQMIFSVQIWLEQQGIEKKKIHFELFTTPDQTTVRSNRKLDSSTKSAPASQVTIKLDGRSFDFDLAFEDEGILDAALKQGADLPFACKGGVCGTCRARLLEGKVEMDVNYALEPEEVAAGFILTCQSHPMTSKVVVDYDAR